MSFHDNIPPAYSSRQEGERVIWNMSAAPEAEQRTMLAHLSGDREWLGKSKGPKKLEVFVQDFCDYCGKHRNVSLIPMQHGWAWYCFWCQIRYLWKTRRYRKAIYQRVAAAPQNSAGMEQAG